MRSARLVAVAILLLVASSPLGMAQDAEMSFFITSAGPGVGMPILSRCGPEVNRCYREGRYRERPRR